MHEEDYRSTSQVQNGDPRPCIPSCVLALSAISHRALIKVFEFLPTTPAETNANKCVHL